MQICPVFAGPVTNYHLTCIIYHSKRCYKACTAVATLGLKVDSIQASISLYIQMKCKVYMYTHQVVHTCIECPHVAMHFVVLLICAPDTCHIEFVVNLYRTRHTAGTTHMKHGLQTATTLQDMLLAVRPARSMISRKQ